MLLKCKGGICTMSKQFNKREKGFTIVEVLIVLAIAAVIMLVVFLAVPALQRNSRNTQRRSDVSHMAGLINEYKASHTGTKPSTYGGKTPAPFCDVSTVSETFATIQPTGAGVACATIAAYAADPTPAVDSWFIYSAATCINNVVSSGGGSNSVAILFYVEPGTTKQCVQV